jgi:hypothetical protein
LKNTHDEIDGPETEQKMKKESGCVDEDGKGKKS